MEFSFNRSTSELTNVLKSKAEKKNIKIVTNKDKTEISLNHEEYKNESIIPVTFKGKFEDTAEGCILKGKYVYGFYLYTLVIVAAILIAARLVASIVQNQMDNIILCGIVTLLLIVVVLVVNKKSIPAKNIINDFLSNLNKK